jgi:hypothetical protein
MLPGEWEIMLAVYLRFVSKMAGKSGVRGNDDDDVFFFVALFLGDELIVN